MAGATVAGFASAAGVAPAPAAGAVVAAGVGAPGAHAASVPAAPTPARPTATFRKRRRSVLFAFICLSPLSFLAKESPGCAVNDYPRGRYPSTTQPLIA